MNECDLILTFAVENSRPNAKRRKITPNWATVSTYGQKHKWKNTSINIMYAKLRIRIRAKHQYVFLSVNSLVDNPTKQWHLIWSSSTHIVNRRCIRTLLYISDGNIYLLNLVSNFYLIFDPKMGKRKGGFSIANISYTRGLMQERKLLFQNNEKTIKSGNSMPTTIK